MGKLPGWQARQEIKGIGQRAQGFSGVPVVVVGDTYRASLAAVKATMQTRLASLLACLLLAHAVLAARKAPELSTWLKKGNDVDGRARE